MCGLVFTVSAVLANKRRPTHNGIDGTTWSAVWTLVEW